MNKISKKTLIIHVGYPKTGSSTLQYGLFDYLNKIGHIDLKTWRYEDPNEMLEDRLSSLLFRKKKVSSKYQFNPRKSLTIVSDESLTAPIRLRQNNFGNDIANPMTFPKSLLKAYQVHVENGLSIKVLVVIRNQADLLYSQYVEEYKLVLNKSVDIIHNKDGEIDLSGMEIYNYSIYLQELEKTFGKKNITVCLFEDLKNNSVKFSEKISPLLQYDSNLIDNLLQKFHFNKKDRNNEGYLTAVSKVNIKYFSDKDKATIMKNFHDSNLMLENDWGIPKDKLYDYKYII